MNKAKSIFGKALRVMGTKFFMSIFDYDKQQQRASFILDFRIPQMSAVALFFVPLISNTGCRSNRNAVS